MVGAPAKDQAEQGSGNAAGAVGDVVGPFADALVAASKSADDEPAGDASVSTSLQLGWLVEDILNGRDVTPYPSDLAFAARIGYVAQAGQLKALLAALKLDDSADPKTVVDKLTSQSAANDEAADCSQSSPARWSARTSGSRRLTASAGT